MNDRSFLHPGWNPGFVAIIARIGFTDERRTGSHWYETAVQVENVA
jgi:hypothetical protein